jgi:hypothetical protein
VRIARQPGKGGIGVEVIDHDGAALEQQVAMLLGPRLERPQRR